MNPSDSPAATGTLDQVRLLLSRATQHLLGATIELDDERWRQASRLPDWTRGHLGTHLARNAEAVGRLAEWALTGEPQQMYPSREQRNADIQAGAGRSSLELQIDLDTTAGELEHAFVRLEETGRWNEQIEVHDTARSARMLPLLRLSEVVLHHLDLDVGFGVGDIDNETCRWLLEFAAMRIGEREEFPRLDVRTDGGFHAGLGSGPDAVQVSGPDQQVLGWLTGRTDGENVAGAERVELPAFA